MMLRSSLVDQLQAGDCVLWIGSDLAAPGAERPSPPGAQQLAQALCERLPPDEHAADNLPHVAWRYQQTEGRTALLQFLAEQLDPPNLAPLPEHGLVAQLPVSLILTTALDSGLPLAFERHGRACRTILGTARVAPHAPGEALIVYLNGQIASPGSLAITPPDHERADRDRALPLIVTADLARKPIVLLGCDLVDDIFRRTYQSVLAQTDRYWQRTYAVDPAPTPFVRAVCDEMQIELLPIEPLALLQRVAAQPGPPSSKSSRHPSSAGKLGWRAARPAPARRPWKGLNPYEQGDADFFFGREDDRRDLFQQIVSCPSTVLCGGSGVGKTSLINAGVAGLLQNEGYKIVPFTVSADAIGALRAAVRATWPELRFDNATGRAQGGSLDHAPPTLAPGARAQLRRLLVARMTPEELRIFCDDLGEELRGLNYYNLPDAWEPKVEELLEFVNRRQQMGVLLRALVDEHVRPDLRVAIVHILSAALANNAADALDQIRPPPVPLPRLVIICDEFEKFFRDEFVPPQARASFVAEVVHIFARADLPIKWVFSLRKESVCDLYTHFELHSRSLLANLYNLKPLTREQAAEAIAGPAEAIGLKLQPELVERLLDDLAQADGIEPPQLQIVCDALCRQAEARRTKQLRVSDYEGAGGATGILRDYLARVLEHFAPGDVRLVKDLLIELAGAQETTLARSAPDLAERLERPVEQVVGYLRHLQEASVIRQRSTDDAVTYELTHAYLIKEINPWLDREARALKEIRDVITRGLENWRHGVQVPLPAEALDVILPHRIDLRLLPEERRIVWHSAVRHGRQLDKRTGRTPVATCYPTIATRAPSSLRRSPARSWLLRWQASGPNGC